MSDFNIRTANEALFVADPEIRSALDLFLQEIDILLSTEKGTIFGKRDLGFNIESLLWKTDFSAGYIESLIKGEITKNCLTAQDFTWSVKVSIVNGTSKDIGVVDVMIKGQTDNLLAQPRFIFK